MLPGINPFATTTVDFNLQNILVKVKHTKITHTQIKVKSIFILYLNVINHLIRSIIIVIIL